MNVNNGDIGSMKKMETKYANEVNNIVPVPSKEISILKGWGKKKRERYAELIKEEGATNEQAFDVVENYKGIIPEKYMGGIELADDFEMTFKDAVTGEEKVMEEGKDYTVK